MAATFDFYKLRHDEFIIKNVHFVSDDKFKTSWHDQRIMYY